MDVEHRYFIVENSGKLVQFLSTAYKKLSIKGSNISLPQHKNSKLRYIRITLNLKDRKPLSVNRTDCCFLKLDNEGKIEWDSWDAACEYGIKFLSYDNIEKKPIKNPKVIDATHIFKMKANRNRWFWKPSQEIEDAIINHLCLFQT